MKSFLRQTAQTCISTVGVMIVLWGLVCAATVLAADSAEDALETMRLAAESKSQFADRRAVDLYERVLAVQPDNRDALWNAAYLHILQKAIALRPDYSVYHHDLCLFYERTGNSSKAREMYRAAIHISPRAPEESIYIEKARKRLSRLES